MIASGGGRPHEQMGASSVAPRRINFNDACGIRGLKPHGYQRETAPRSFKRSKVQWRAEECPPRAWVDVLLVGRASRWAHQASLRDASILMWVRDPWAEATRLPAGDRSAVL